MLKEFLLSKLSEEEFIELNGLLKELKKILPDTVFNYSDETGVIEGLSLIIDNTPNLDINFFLSIPRYNAPFNVLQKPEETGAVKDDRKPASTV